VLPESEDERIIIAAASIIEQELAKIVLIGDREKLLSTYPNINLDRATIINPKTYKYTEDYALKLYEMRKRKGMTEEEAREKIQDSLYFAVMMVKMNDADGMVAGAIHSTGDTLRPALQILKTAPGTRLVSSLFIMVVPGCELVENGIFVYADCGLVENPVADELSEIALSSARTFRTLVGGVPKVAMLSYSTFGSAKSKFTQKVIDATSIAKVKEPGLILDGEMQVDAAIVPSVAKAKAPDCVIQGDANVLVFPDLNSGNIAYKLTQRLACAEAYGPITQGIAKPVNDLSRGCSVDDIVGVVAITAVQAQMSEN
jgi:phosphate acetyltransferase